MSARMLVKGPLDRINISSQYGRNYIWENFHEIVQIIAYCFLYEASKIPEPLSRINKSCNKQYVQNMNVFFESFKMKLSKELDCQPWEAMKYMFYPEGAKIPDQDGQRKLIDRYIGSLACILVDSGNLVNYLTYLSNFVTDQLLELDCYEVWQRNLKDDDYKMLRKVVEVMYRLSCSILGYIIKRYEFEQGQDQLIRYTELKTKYIAESLFPKPLKYEDYE